MMFCQKKNIYIVFSTGSHKLVTPLTKMEHTTKAVNKIKHFKSFKIVLHSRLLTTHLLTVLLCNKNDITYLVHQKWKHISD